jgi:uroporphyrinogen-III decarboxylase
MTGKARLLAALRGDEPDLVPFSPNLYYWFYHHQRNGTLPRELSFAEHPLDALRRLGADILVRWDTKWATREVYTAGEYSEEYTGESAWNVPVITAFNRYPPGKTERRERFVTPHGTLTHAWTFSREAGTDFERDFWWKDWRDYEAVRFMLESKDYVFDAAEFRSWVDRVGEDGLVMAHITQSPLKLFHWLAGAENTTFFLADHPEQMAELARIHEAKALALLEGIVRDSAIDLFIALDNLDSTFYPPRLYRLYCGDFFAKAAEIIHSCGKTLLVHACGRNKALLPLAGASGIDCLEGITPPPTGDVELWQARAMAGYANFTVNGGMDVVRQETHGADAEARIHEYTRRLFEAMKQKTHFIFASSCATSLKTSWRNLVFFRDAARKYSWLNAGQG